MALASLIILVTTLFVAIAYSFASAYCVGGSLASLGAVLTLTWPFFVFWILAPSLPSPKTYWQKRLQVWSNGPLHSVSHAFGWPLPLLVWDSGDTNRLWMIRYYMTQVRLSGVVETAKQHVSQSANIGSCPRNPGIRMEGSRLSPVWPPCLQRMLRVQVVDGVLDIAGLCGSPEGKHLVARLSRINVRSVRYANLCHR